MYIHTHLKYHFKLTLSSYEASLNDKTKLLKLPCLYSYTMVIKM